MYAPQSGYPPGSARAPIGGVAASSSYAAASAPPAYTASATTTTYRSAGGQQMASQVAPGGQPLPSRAVVSPASMGPGPTAVRTVISASGQQMTYAQGATVIRQAPVPQQGAPVGAQHQQHQQQQQGYTRPAPGAVALTVVGSRPPAAVTPASSPSAPGALYSQPHPSLVQASSAVMSTKPPEDPQLSNLKELRRASGLRYVPVARALPAVRATSVEGTFTREQFCAGYLQLLVDQGIEIPSEDIQHAVFDLFDRDDNGVVDMLELICGLSMLCAGDQEEKIRAVFSVFDENGDGFISMDEMFKFLTAVFKVVLTGSVMKQMNTLGVAVESSEDLASVTALECFKNANLNQDGKLSIAEFKNWFYAPKSNPSFLFPSAMGGTC